VTSRSICCASSEALACPGAGQTQDIWGRVPGMGRPVLCPYPPAAPPAGRMPQSPALQLFTRSCTPFSPTRVDNSLAPAPRLARSRLPRSSRAPAMSCPPLRTAASLERSARASGRGSRPSGCPGTPSRTGVSGAAGTALRRQGRVVAQAAGPRHRRPRLRHRPYRRGEASVASTPSQACARVVTKVRQSAQPPADPSVQRLRQRRAGRPHCLLDG